MAAARGGARSPSSGAWRLPNVSLLLVMALMLAPWPADRRPARRHWRPLASRLAAAQGLQSTADQLAASEAATASEFDTFEDALSLAAQTTGGRGRSGKGGTGKSIFTDADKLLRLQQGMQYIGGSPDAYPTCRFKDGAAWDPTRSSRRPDCNNFVPWPKDQGDCSTCVTQAIAAAMQISVAATLQEPVEDWEVSVPSLYYCSKGGRTCKTGWDIQEALNFLLDEEPELIRPSACLTSVPEFNNADIQASTNQWKEVCDRAQQAMAACSTANPRSLSLNCTYKSLGSFWEMQRHIRQHGAVITRIRIPSDFEKQFGANASQFSGEEFPPYRFVDTVQGLYGHAVVIVGYNNTERTWTVLNSWGNSTTRPNRTGVMTDGLFKVQMGLLAIGTPDVTYGVECAPAPDSQRFQQRDPHQLVHLGTQTWQPAKAVEIAPGADPQDLDAPCYIYRFNASTDTVSSIVDHFGLDVTAFVRDNKAFFPDQSISYRFVGKLLLPELQLVLDAAKKALNGSGAQPYARCTFYGPPGNETEIALNCTTNAADCMRLGTNGTVGCKLVYSAANVTDMLPDGTPLHICGISRDPGAFYRVARVDGVKASQLRALRGILRALGQGDVVVPEDFCDPSASWASYDVGVRKCDQDGWVTSAYAGDPHADGAAAKLTPTEIGNALLQPLMQLERLEEIMLVAFDGPLPPQLGALSRMQFLQVYSYCAWGTLPPSWLDGWRDIRAVTVRPLPQDTRITSFAGHSCGITGVVPERWSSSAGSRSLRILHISESLLSGELPPLTGMPSLEDVTLSGNAFVGGLPRTWPRDLRNLTNIDVSRNAGLAGLVPREWSSITSRPGGDVSIQLDNTGLGGCLPFGNTGTSYVFYSGTNITGNCSRTVEQMLDRERMQARAMANVFTKLLADRSQVDSNVAAVVRYFGNASTWYGDMLDWAGAGHVEERRETAVSSYGSAIVVDLKWDTAQGVVYVTKVAARGLSLDLTQLGDFVSQLPGLEELSLSYCSPIESPNAGRLPADLPRRAGERLRVLELMLSGVKGTLPDKQWGQWSTIQELILQGNDLTGALPPSWGRGMESLQRLHLSYNQLTGPLPLQWKGMRSLAPGLGPDLKLTMDLSGNDRINGTLPALWGDSGSSAMPDGITLGFVGCTGLSGTIPPSYKRFGEIALASAFGGTSLSGCIPPGVKVLGSSLPSCASDERQVVKRLHDLLAAAYGSASWALDAWLEPPQDDTAHCLNKAGIQCDADGHVTKVDLPALHLRVTVQTQLQTTSLFNALNGLPELQTLVAAKMRLVGPLPELPADGGATGFSKLRTIDLSGNPNISGSLPPSWQALQDLQSVDVSGCSGVTGSLPEDWAALQSLQVLRAANTGISGQLPPVYGLLSSLQELDVSNARLSGPPVPPAWLDVLQLQEAVAASRLKSAQAQLAAQTAAAAAAAAAAVATADAGGQPSGRRAATSAEPILFLTRLKVLRLANNQFSGRLEPGLSMLRALRVVDLSATSGQGNVTGALPPDWMALSQLQELSLSGQKLSGALPPQWSKLSRLVWVRLARNLLSGPLPTQWVVMKKLRGLDLSGNRGLTGQVPALWLRLKWCSKVLLGGTGVTGC